MSKLRGISIYFSVVSMLVGSVALAGPRIRLMNNKGAEVKSFSLPPAPAGKASGNLVYQGGPVISNVKIIGVFWGTAVDPTVRSQIGDFYKTLVTGPMMDWLSEYNTKGVKGVTGQSTNQTIGRGSYAGDFVITPKNKATTLSDEDVQGEIQGQIEAGVLPAADNNSLYMVHFPAGIDIEPQAGMKSCQDFCAYHNSYKGTNSQNVYYGVMPDYAQSACSMGCGQYGPFGDFTSGASHEVIEAVTDAEVGTNPSVGYPMAWFDTSINQEIGDICAYKSSGTISSTNGTKYTIQGEWSNKRKTCAFAPAHSKGH